MNFVQLPFSCMFTLDPIWTRRLFLAQGWERDGISDYLTCLLHEMAPRSCSVTIVINPVSFFITIAALSVFTAQFSGKLPHVVPGFQTGSPEFHKLSLTGSLCHQITLIAFMFTWTYAYTRASKPRGWLNFRARRRLRGRIRMHNEAVDRCLPLSLATIILRASIEERKREIEQRAAYEALARQRASFTYKAQMRGLIPALIEVSEPYIDLLKVVAKAGRGAPKQLLTQGGG